MKKTLIIILIIISSCASSKQQRSLIDQQADKIDEINQLNSSTFDLGKYFEKEKGTFTISTHNNELKKIIIDSRMNNDQNTITIFIKKNQPFLIRQNLVSILKLYKDDGNVETQDLKSKTDFYISNWKPPLPRDCIAWGFFIRLTPRYRAIASRGDSSSVLRPKSCSLTSNNDPPPRNSVSPLCLSVVQL